MNTIRQVIILLRNTLLVTLAVAGGFTLGGAIGVSNWLQIVCLIPAGYLFIRLSGEPIPPMSRWVPYAVGITGVVSVASLANGLVQTRFPSLSGSSWPTILIFSVAFLPMRSFAAFIERHWPFGGGDASPKTKTG
jgi:hypothetical protein